MGRGRQLPEHQPLGPVGIPSAVSVRRGRARVPFIFKFGGATVAAGASADLIVIAAQERQGMQGVITSFACELEENAAGAYDWSDADGAGGAFFRVLVGKSILDGLNVINSPWGIVGHRQPIWLPFGSAEKIVIRGINTHATDSVEMCAQIEGAWVSALQEL